MLHNDISNQSSFVIGFRCEGTLLKPKDSLRDKIKNLIYDKYVNAEVSAEVLSLMKYIYYSTEMTCVLIVDKENYTKRLEEYLLDFPCSQMKVVLKSINEITMMLNTGELTYFITNDSIEKSLVNSIYAMNFSDFNTLIKRRVKRFE